MELMKTGSVPWHDTESRDFQKAHSSSPFYPLLPSPPLMRPLTVLTRELRGLGVHSRVVVLKFDYVSESP